MCAAYIIKEQPKPKVTKNGGLEFQHTQHLQQKQYIYRVMTGQRRILLSFQG